MKSKLISTILAAAMTLSAVTLPMPLKTNAEADSLIVRKFDLGGLGVADGYIGVSASEGIGFGVRFKRHGKRDSR